MKPIDAKSNVSLLMNLLGVTPAMMAPAIDTDITLISRWRTGQRKLVAGRPWGAKVAAYFASIDGVYATPVLRAVMGALYPNKPCDTPDQLRECTHQFLLCPGQQEFEYRLRRYELLKDVLPGRMLPPTNPDAVVDHIGEWTHGRQKMMAAIMEFFGTVAQTAPQRMVLVAPNGLNAILDLDPHFAIKVMERLSDLFQMGHKLSIVCKSDYEATGRDVFLARLEAMHLRGQIDTHFCEASVLLTETDRSIILTTKSHICVSAVFPAGCPHKARTLSVKSPVTCAKTHYMALKLRLHSEEDHLHDVFPDPGRFFEGVHRRALDMDGGVFYYISDIPFFCALDCDGLIDAYRLNEYDGTILINGRFELQTLRPSMVRNGSVRWILCRDEIERALVTDDVECTEMSYMMGHMIHMGRRGLLKLLFGMLSEMDKAESFELALLPRHLMNLLGLRAYILKDTISLGSGPDGISTSSRNEGRVRWAMDYAETAWNRIPAGMKNRQANLRYLRALANQHLRIQAEEDRLLAEAEAAARAAWQQRLDTAQFIAEQEAEDWADLWDALRDDWG